MVGSRLALVIPALNESASIAMVVRRAAQLGLPIVVDDGSNDATGAIAAAEGADVVRHPVNRGYDGALSSGFARAVQLGCDTIITLDADGQHNPGLITTFEAALESADVVVGIRDRHQRLAESVFAWLGQRIWGISDPLCGMKGYRIDVYRRLGHFDSYRSIGTELALFAARSGFRVTQVPVPTRPRVGASRFGQLLRGNWMIFRALAIALVRLPRQRRARR
ncbi:MAG: glycosyltransferase family 2 protein [Gammaproteobacteria bacterium]